MLIYHESIPLLETGGDFPAISLKRKTFTFAFILVNSWWEIQVCGDSALEDLIFWRLEAFGCQGTSSQVKGRSRLVRAYLPENQIHPSDLAALALLLQRDAISLGFASPEAQWNLVEEEDWSNSWKQYWQPQEIGDRFLIHPAWLGSPQASGRLLLRLDPGMAFGTGTHATTQLCLEAVERQLSNPTSSMIVADIGCGSGILSIGAVLLGAGQVYAVDTDPLAVQSACSNRDLNQIDSSRIVVEQGSIECLIELVSHPVDGILCNILAEVIIDLVPQINAIAKPTTWGILSGILGEQAEQVTETLVQQGWTVSST